MTRSRATTRRLCYQTTDIAESRTLSRAPDCLTSALRMNRAIEFSSPAKRCRRSLADAVKGIFLLLGGEDAEDGHDDVNSRVPSGTFYIGFRYVAKASY
jgi:hypothetical protein